MSGPPLPAKHNICATVEQVKVNTAWTGSKLPLLARNTSKVQMKMLLTRLGHNSKCVVTGDITQIDLPAGSQSGLVNALDVLRDTQGIATVFFSEEDVIRHPLVASIVEAYRRNGGQSQAAAGAPRKEDSAL
jgi:phosphate starvation-inducible PhoH-like protein